MEIYHKRKIPAKADMSICIIILQLLRRGKEEAEKTNEWARVNDCAELQQQGGYFREPVLLYLCAFH